MWLEAAYHSQTQSDDRRKRDVVFGCIEASDTEGVQNMINVYSNEFPLGSVEYWRASPQTAYIHRMYPNRIEIAYESRHLEASYSPACDTSLSILSFDIPNTT
jgi:hypothetical protein